MVLMRKVRVGCIGACREAQAVLVWVEPSLFHWSQRRSYDIFSLSSRQQVSSYIASIKPTNTGEYGQERLELASKKAFCWICVDSILSSPLEDAWKYLKRRHPDQEHPRDAKHLQCQSFFASGRVATAAIDYILIRRTISAYLINRSW